nr:radical SAM protein [Candidatus Sigynarchaeota archaeon]
MEHVGLELREPDASNLDSPHPGREFRLYVAITNRCNRSCPFCSTFSSLAGSWFISLAQIMAHVPREGLFQVQLEGGEPFMHPRINEFVDAFSHMDRCTKIIITTNGSLFPFIIDGRGMDIERSTMELTRFFSRYHGKVLFKISL